MNGKTIPQQDALPLVSKPPVESFFDSKHADALWPQPITAQLDFRTQTETQQALLGVVQTVFANLPIGITLAAGLESGLITEVVAIDLLNRLARYLESDAAYGRIIFYLPLELTSPIQTSSAVLHVAADRFQKMYRRIWEAQLGQYDIRANFVDGDVLETTKRTGDPLRVVKATHLIPGLIESGHMTLAEVTAYARKSSDPLLRHGIQEACAVIKSPKITEEAAVSAEEIRITLLANITEASCLEDRAVTPNRLRWLRQTAILKAITRSAKKLMPIVGNGAALPIPATIDTSMLSAYIEAVRLVMLNEQKLANRYRDWLASVTESTNNKAVHASVAKLYRHAYTVGILQDESEGADNIHLPALEGPFSKNLNDFSPSLPECSVMITQIVQNAYLSSRVYPVTILFGSQLKGYDAENADADVAVFIKPGTPLLDFPEIAKSLRHIFAHERIMGSVVMFSLDMVDTHLVVTGNTQTTDAPPLYSWTHVLMGGAWIGETASIAKLQHELLVPYLFNPTVTLDGKPIRERWLEEMERDSIQYRLLHKGYERYYPIRNPQYIGAGSTVDGGSPFYDPTFRRIATLLFLTRVFFPKLDL